MPFRLWRHGDAGGSASTAPWAGKDRQSVRRQRIERRQFGHFPTLPAGNEEHGKRVIDGRLHQKKFHKC